MEKYIYINKKSLSQEVCRDLIEMFENEDRKYDGVTHGGIQKNIKDTKDFTIPENEPKWYKYHQLFHNELTRNLQIYLNKLKSLLIDCLQDSFNNKIISSLINRDLPYYFLNKIEESNIIIGHQQLEQHNILINIIKNKNRDEKIETFKKNHIYKCIQWCERHKIPYNKFVDKINIFLPSTYEEEEDQEDQEEDIVPNSHSLTLQLAPDEIDNEYEELIYCIEKERNIMNFPDLM